MKLLIAFSVLSLQAASFAAGYDCSAYCVEVDTARSTVHVVERMNVVAGTKTAKEAHKLLEKKCRSQLHRGMLVDKVDFRNSQTTNTHYSSGHSYSYHHYYFSYSGSSYSTYSRYNYKKLDIQFSSSLPKVACEVDAEVEDGDLPYTGNLEVF